MIEALKMISRIVFTNINIYKIKFSEIEEGNLSHIPTLLHLKLLKNIFSDCLVVHTKIPRGKVQVLQKLEEIKEGTCIRRVSLEDLIRQLEHQELNENFKDIESVLSKLDSNSSDKE